MKTVTRKIILALFLPVIIVIAWASVTTSGKVPSGILPSLPSVGKAFETMVTTGQLQGDLLKKLKL